MILNQVKLDRADIFINYVASIFSLAFPLKNLISDKMVLRLPNSLKLPQLVENELDKTF